MTQDPQQLVIPEPDAFGFRVNARTPLAHVVAVVRRANPRAPYAQVKLLAEQLRLGTVSRERTPGRFDSGAAAGAADSPAAVVDGGSAPTESAPDPARLDEIEHGKLVRADVAAWAAQNGHDVPPKGFLPGAVIAAYRAAQRDEYMASLVPVLNPDGSTAEPMPADALPEVR